MIPIVTFDFDSTLSRPDVQEYAAKLISEGVNVWVLTSRYDDLNAHRWVEDIRDCNVEVYAVVDRLGIPRNNIKFTNMTSKSIHLLNTKVLWHLDDDHAELFNIENNKDVKTIGIQVNSGTWKSKCQRILKKHYNYYKSN